MRSVSQWTPRGLGRGAGLGKEGKREKIKKSVKSGYLKKTCYSYV
jgi:hypothetical protein